MPSLLSELATCALVIGVGPQSSRHLYCYDIVVFALAGSVCLLFDFAESSYRILCKARWKMGDD